MSIDFASTLRVLEQQLAALKESAAANPDLDAARREAYAAGWRDCHRHITAGVRQILNDAIRQHLTPNEPAPSVAPTPHSPPDTEPRRLSAPTKDQLVRDYLATNPGARYRDMNRALPTYVATRVYALEKRGEVTKDPEGRFHLTGVSDAPIPPNRKLP